VKQADRPDSVQPLHLSAPRPWPPFVWAGPRGRGSVPPTRRLGRAALPARACARATPAYLVLLRAEIARFTLRGAGPRADSSLLLW